VDDSGATGLFLDELSRVEADCFAIRLELLPLKFHLSHCGALLWFLFFRFLPHMTFVPRPSYSDRPIRCSPFILV